MKKILLSTVILGIGMLGFSQKRAILPKEKVNESKTIILQKPATGAEAVQMPVIPAPSVPAASKGELIAGETVYDVQTNSSLGNRMWLFGDGTAAAVWTMGLGSNPAGPERGTGYNYFDGTSWGDPPTVRIEDDRCGWPSIAAWGENGEIVVSHLAGQTVYTDGGLLINKREEKGTGDWTQIYLPGPAGMGGTDITWPRLTTSGANHEYIHIIVPSASDEYADQKRPLFYIRSDDGGETWTEWKILDEINSDYYSGFHADDYTWAESRGNTIAFTIASPWHDWIVMKSTDNGDTWTKIVIWEHPYPMWDWDNTITTDTIWATDYSADIAIDADGMVHAVCGLTRVAHTETGTSYSYWPFTDGIIYWDETMPSFTAENQHRALAYENLVEDKTLIGYVVDQGTPLLDEILTYPELGMSTMPTISISPTNFVFVAWSSVTEGYDNGQFNFRHIWMRYSTENGSADSWGDFTDLDTNISHWLDECIYPVLAGNVEFVPTGQKFHLIYNADELPGLFFLQTPSQNDATDNTIYEYSDIVIGTGDNQITTEVSVSQNLPNPFSSVSVINVSLTKRSNLSLEVVNIVGQVVYKIDQGMVNSGKHSFKIDAKNFEPGLYFYTVKAGGNSVTKKMIIE